MKTKKKALMFEGIMFFIILVILVTAFVTLYKKQNKFSSGYLVGDRQFALIRTYQQAEKALFYIDESAKYAAQQTAYNLAKKGGFIESDCGSHLGANLWLKGEGDTIKACYPIEQSLKNNFTQVFNEELTKYLEIYPDALIPAYYDYELSGGLEIKGIAKENLFINIVTEKFVVKPSAAPIEESELLRVPIKPGIDIQTIRDYHPEVLVKYAELCKRIGLEPTHECTLPLKKCCITSGYRHPSRNQEEKGARNSAHQYGLALDIYIGPLKEQLRVAKLNEGNDNQPKLFTRVGVYPSDTHIHVDLMPLKGAYAVPYFVAKGGQTLATANNLADLENKATRIT